MPKKDKAAKAAAKAEKKSAKADTANVAEAGADEETFFVRTGKTAAHRANLNMVGPPAAQPSAH